MHDPDVRLELDNVDGPISVAAPRESDFKDARAKPFIGLAISALRPSAAMIRALRIADCAPSGNSSKSVLAALIQETDLVSLTMLEC
jgi:hypothetical protein